MRLKSYNAPSMAEAMQILRRELGEDAIIVSTQRAAGGKGVRITAALEEPEDGGGTDALGQAASAAVAHSLREAFEQHGLPARIIEKLAAAAHANGLSDPVLACAAALETEFVFAPLPDQAAPRPFMLIGPPGAGKTMATAKLAARSVLKHRRVGLVTTDNQRAGAVEQLAAFTRILEIDLRTARSPAALRRQLDAILPSSELVFIDTPGLNPFKSADLDFLAALVEAVDSEPILVLPAGGDPAEAAEMGEAFGSAGATRLLATRLDITRRLGGIMAAADAAQLMFCDVSSNPHVANGLTPLSPVALARLIVPPAAQSEMKDANFWTEVSP